jgi:choline dehydrogenase
VTPQSRGRLVLRSTDPTQHPAIHANYLSREADLQTLIEGVKLARDLGQTKAFAPFYQEEIMPGPGVQSDKEIADYLRNNVESIYHPVGACKMGHDDLAVVDEQLRVRGVEGLRVVDASIMPTIVNANTNAPTIMIAEKGADLLRGHSASGADQRVPDQVGAFVRFSSATSG